MTTKKAKSEIPNHLGIEDERVEELGKEVKGLVKVSNGEVKELLKNISDTYEDKNEAILQAWGIALMLKDMGAMGGKNE